MDDKIPARANVEATIEADYAEYVAAVDPQEGMPSLPPEISGHIESMNRSAFKAGWCACASRHIVGQRSTEGRPATVRALVDVGDRAWVDPLAIVEHMPTGDRFVDPLFPIHPRPSAKCSVELMVAEAGLVAVGPTDFHRLSRAVDGARLRPLVAFEAAT